MLMTMAESWPLIKQLIFVCRNVDSTTLAKRCPKRRSWHRLDASVWDMTAWETKGAEVSFDATTIVQELLAPCLG